MEVALVSGILKIIGIKLAPLVIKEFSSIAGVAKDLQGLQNRVEEINIWLENVGNKELGNERSSDWIKRLKDVAYDTEDLVHEFHMVAEKHDRNVVGLNNIMVKYLWTKPRSALYEYKTAHKIKAIKRRFDAIVKGRSDYSTIANSMPLDRSVPHISKTIGEVPLWTNMDEPSTFGRDKAKNRIIAELIEINLQHKIKVVSVVGLGGSGKTTLAKLVFNDSNIIKEHFKVLLWVHVSREFVVENLVEKLFEAIAGHNRHYISLQRVSRTISDNLAGQRFLVVLDDVWTEDRIHWEQFMVHLKGGAPGSSILLTTRSRKVAEVVDSTYTFDLPFLSEEDSWKVFQQSFGMTMKDLDPEFLKVAIEIVNKCGGVPLAVKVFAGVLHGMKRIEEWQSIRDSNLLDVEDEERRVFACLWLSYFHLPHHLKHCFTYCSIFPKGYEIRRQRLISQWIAYGFVNQTNQTQQPEDVGIAYFDSLVKMGFLQDLRQHQYKTGEETICKMHDLVHDLTRQILRDEFVYEIATADQIKVCRYLSLTSCSGKVDSKLLDKARSLYICMGDLKLDKTASKTCCIRTIILEHISAALLPLSVGKFQHLGYLEISYVDCEALPEAISHCWNLQVILVSYCRRLSTLPDSVGKLKKLKTLELTDCGNIRSLPRTIGGCHNLQRLCLYGCGIEDIPNSIGKVEKLRFLNIVCCSHLRQLVPSESFGKLSNLQSITIKDCEALHYLPQSITLLTHLEYLDLEDCSELVELPKGIGNLTKLQILNLKGCNKLCGLPAGFGQLTRLQKLGLFVAGESTEHARILELENLDNLHGDLQIKNINCVKDSIDAERVHLKRKKGIRKLLLDWHSRGEVRDSEMEEESFVEVRTEEELLLDIGHDLLLLNYLEPPSEIEELGVSCYRGSELPCWMIKQSDFCYVAGIHMMKQSDLPHFTRLTKLVLEDLPNLERLQGFVDMSGIRILELRVMPKLVELLINTTGLVNGKKQLEVQPCFPNLSALVISDCPKLIVKPYLPRSLKRLTLKGSIEQLWSSGGFFDPRHTVGDESLSSSYAVDVKLTELHLIEITGSSSDWKLLQYVTGIHNLEISECNDLRQLPEDMRSLTCLHRLTIRYCNNLCMLPEWLGELQCLQGLFIIGLPKLSNLPQSIQCLTSLQDLDIDGCPALHRLPEQLGELCSLQTLGIMNLCGLSCIPDCMQRLTSLRDINLYNCSALTQLPESIGELSALRSLSIMFCPGLTSLPSSIQRLIALEELEIRYCPELARRCKEGVGEDWHLVSHIPYLRLLG